eukprot:TRINITY_DN394_c0_g1_i6.p2 TRINITY_DN394_c0_g1~~TRINITY_DN394_c0_g1_i6.p2  ORF type:complete len:119 (-),score=6.65 TRINITY_DN394_c0_g1_i6:185-541(-)
MATVLPESALLNEVLFTGQRYEPQVQLYLFRMRFLSPNTGTFLSRDPLAYPDGPNAYTAWFVLGRTDFNGLEEVTFLWPLSSNRPVGDTTIVGTIKSPSPNWVPPGATKNEICHEFFF